MHLNNRYFRCARLLPDRTLGAGDAALWNAARQTWPVETMGERQMISLDKEYPNKVIFDCDTCSQGSKYGAMVEGYW